MGTLLTFLVEAIRLGMTFLFGSTGEIITEKSGHLNLGIPGVMCVGASCGCLAESIYFDMTGGNLNPVLAVVIPIVCAILGGALMGLIFSVLTVTLRANQNVTGLALTTFGVGVSNFMVAKIGTTFSIGSKYFRVPLPFASDLSWAENLPFSNVITFIVKLFFSYGILVYLAIGIAVVSAIVLTKTRTGLHLRAVGENPATADAAGINVTAYRYISTCIGCGIAGIGGLSFIMDYLVGNWEYTIDAMGWLSIALVIFTVWKPGVAIFGSIIFGGLYIASSYIPGIGFEVKELFKMLPYLVTIIVLIITSIRNKKENQPPQSLGLSYFREER